MGRRDEDRVVEQIFPIAGELLLRHDAGLDGPVHAVGEHDGIADPGLCRVAEIQRREPKMAKRLDEPEAGLLVVGERVRRDETPVLAGQPDFLGLGDQIADGEHQAILADDHAAALAAGAEHRGGEGVIGN
jgi:hypothetical protein